MIDMRNIMVCIMMSFLSGLFGNKARAQDGNTKWDPAVYSKTDTSLFYPPFADDPLEEKYFKASEYIWVNLVPKSGQAETLQGELIRAAERLDYEIRDNGKANWNKQFVMLGDFLRNTLINSKIFPKEVEQEIAQDIRSLIKDDHTVITEDPVYNRITRRVVEWYWRHKEPIKHKADPKLKI